MPKVGDWMEVRSANLGPPGGVVTPDVRVVVQTSSVAAKYAAAAAAAATGSVIVLG